MLEALPKAMFSLLASSGTLKSLASRYGLRGPTGFARRFIAGETIDDAIATAHEIHRAGLEVTLDHLGESVATREGATLATRAYISAIDAIVRSSISRNLSIKLTQLGLDIDKATSLDNLRRVLDAAGHASVFVRIDMEGSAYTDLTLDTFETLWSIGYRDVGVVLQSSLKRTPADLERVLRLGGRVRLVKGAYREPRDVAFHHKRDVDAAFVELMRILLRRSTRPAIATHDPAMIESTRTFAAQHSLAPETFEFQMLYGIRRDLQTMLSRNGYTVRIYVPYGREWFPYFMRRLGERPANVTFVIKSLMREKN